MEGTLQTGTKVPILLVLVAKKVKLKYLIKGV